MEFLSSLAVVLVMLFWIYLCVSGYLVAILGPALLLEYKFQVSVAASEATRVGYGIYFIVMSAAWAMVLLAPLYALYQ